MDDYEHSVQSLEYDWNSFLQECEECNVLSPALAGVDSSGMSDIDQLGSNPSNLNTKSCLGVRFSEAQHPISSPPDHEESPDEHYLSKYCIGCLENVLSGSEDDVHMESVNRFFETLKSVTEAEERVEPSQAAVGKTRGGVMSREEHKSCKSGLSTNIPIVSPRPASKVLACTEKIKYISHIVSKANDPDTGREMGTSIHPSTHFVISDENQTMRAENNAWKQNLFHDSSSVPIYPETILASNRELMSNVDVREAAGDWRPGYVQHYMSTSTNRTIPGQQSATTETLCHSSPSSPLRKKRRRRKKRASADPVESGHGAEMNFSVDQSDSGEELCSWAGKRNVSLSSDYGAVCVTKTECDDTQHISGKKAVCSAAAFPPPSEIVQRGVSSNMPHGLTSMEITNDGLLSPTAPQSGCQTETPDLSESSVVTQRLATGAWGHSPMSCLSLNSTGAKRLSFPPGQTDDHLLSTPKDSGIITTDFQPCQALQIEASTESPDLSASVSTCGIRETIPEGGDYSSTELSTCIGEYEPLKQDITVGNKTVCVSVKAFMREPFSPSFESNTLTLPLSIAMTGCKQKGLSIPKTVQSELEKVLDLTAVEKPKGVGRGSSEKKPTRQIMVEQLSKPNLDSGFKMGALTNWPVSGETLEMAGHSQESLQQSAELSTSLNNHVRQIVPESHSSIDLPITPSSGYSNNSASKSSLGLGLVHDKSPVTSVTTLSNKEMFKENPLDESTTQKAFIAQGEHISLIPAGNASEWKISKCVGQDISQEKLKLKVELKDTREDIVIANQTTNREMVGKTPEVVQSVCTMSSFWKEMEKLTINDILCLRTKSNAPPSSRSQTGESEAADPSVAEDTSYLIDLGNSKFDHSFGDKLTISNVVDDSLHNTGILWESQQEPVINSADKRTESVSAPTAVSDTQLPSSNSSCATTSQRNICKSESVQNLRALALEPISHRCQSTDLPAVISEEGEAELDCVTDEHMPSQNAGLASLTPTTLDKDVSTKSHGLSLPTFFQYFFGSRPFEASPLESNNLSTYYADGNSVPETYDNFFSEFDSTLFSNPLKWTSSQKEDDRVPTFSCSRSAKRNLQFPEVYEKFFQSSFSDSSSMESEEEDNEVHAPIRVVTRFSNKANESQSAIETADIYENFFTDGRLDLFWKNSFSLRKSQFTVSASQRKESICLSVLPISQTMRASQRPAQVTNKLGYQTMPFPDPLCYNMQDRIRRLREPPFRYEDQRIANPRLDASLIPLKQSDICLVCIAFASWVLKSANPQVEDTWKAVLLANISALSAIGYLRKYVRKDPNGEKPLPQTPL